MIIGMQRRQRDGCATSGSRKWSSWLRRKSCSRSCRSARSRRKRSSRRAKKSSTCCTARTPRLLVVVGPCSVHDPKAALDYAAPPRRRRRGAERPPADRDAGLLREAADDDRLEGPDQRPAPGRLRRRQRRPAHGPQAAARGPRRSGCRSAASSSTRSRRSTSPTPSPGGRSAPAPPRARPTASSAPASRCRSASRTAPTATSRSRSTRSVPPPAPHAFAGIDDAGAPAILHTTGNPDCHIILRGGHGMPNYHVPDVEDALVTLRSLRAAGAAGHRRLPRQQRQGP